MRIVCLSLASSWLFFGAASAQCEMLVFGPVIKVNELNSPPGGFSDELSGGSFTADGLTVVIESRRQGSSTNRPYSATRPDVNSPFGPLSDADFINQWGPTGSGGGSPVISGDGLTLFYDGGPDGIQVATRATTSEPFSAGSAVPNLPLFARPSWLSPDGLRLYLHTDMLLVAERSDINSAFAAPTGDIFANLNTTGGGVSSSLTSNELRVFFASDRPGGVGTIDIWTATRPNKTSAFGLPVNLSSINSTSHDKSPAVIGNELYFESTRDGNSNEFFWREIFKADLLSVPAPAPIIGLIGMAAMVCVAQGWKRYKDIS